MITPRHSVLTLEEIRATVASALKGTSAKKAILFGSYARGEADGFSDLDIIVVAETEKRFLDRYEDFVAVVMGVPLAVDLLVYTPAELQMMIDKGNPFIEKALGEGVVIYEAG